MGSAIILGYVKLIIEDETFAMNLVPKRHREAVKEELKKQGYDDQGKKIELNDNGK